MKQSVCQRGEGAGARESQRDLGVSAAFEFAPEPLSPESSILTLDVTGPPRYTKVAYEIGPEAIVRAGRFE